MFEVLNDKNMLESVELAKGIQKNVCRTANRPNKGVKQDAFLVLRETSMPACLIELGYISTASEETYLNSSANVDAMGRGIYQAFVQYKNKTTGKLPTSVQEETVAPEPVKQETPVKKDTIEVKPVPEPSVDESLPVFKVQLMASGSRLASNDARFKGLEGVESYQEGGLWKYTVGSTSDYNEIRKVRQQVTKAFPQAFIIAFRNGVKMDVQTAIREMKSVKK